MKRIISSLLAISLSVLTPAVSVGTVEAVLTNGVASRRESATMKRLVKRNII